MNRVATAIVFITLQLSAASASHANSVAGRVLFAAGPNSVERDGPTVELLKGSFVFEGDTIHTGKRGRLQLLMVDGARIAIRPNTEFTVQDYELADATTDPIAVASGDGKVTLRLAKGAFRAISGEIGKSYVKANYQVIAPVATMGIRGTDYVVRFCDGDCGGGDSPPADGLYIGVNVGGIWAQNAADEVDMDAGEFVWIPAADRSPEFLLEPPALLRSRSQEDEQEDEDSEEDSNTEATGDQENEPPGTPVDDDDDATGDPAEPDRPEQTITARNEDSGVTLRLEDGSIEDDLAEIPEAQEPDPQPDNVGGNTDNGSDGNPSDGNAGGNPNDGNGGDPSNGDAGGGNDDGANSGDGGGNPNDGNGGGNPNDGNGGDPSNGDAGGGNDDGANSGDGGGNPNDGNDGGNPNDGNDGDLTDGNAGGGNPNDGNDGDLTDGNAGGGNDDGAGNGGNGNTGGNPNSGDNGNAGGGNPNDGNDADLTDGNAGGGNDGDNGNAGGGGNSGGMPPMDGGSGAGNGQGDDRDSDDSGNSGNGGDEGDSEDNSESGNPNSGEDDDADDGNTGGGNDNSNNGNGGNPNDDRDGEIGDGNAGGGNDNSNNGNGGNPNDDRDGEIGDGNAGRGNDKDKDGDGNEVEGTGSADESRGIARGAAPPAGAAAVVDGRADTFDASLFQNQPADGSDLSTGIKWGRWETGFADRQPVHYVADTDTNREVVLPTEGTLEYTLSGGTAPTDSLGNTGTLDSGKLTADFTHQTVSNEIRISIGGDTWHATGTGSLDTGAPVFEGSYEVTRGSGATGTGHFSGFLGGAPLPDGPFQGAPSGAGVGYGLESNGITVEGAAGFSANP